MTKSNVQALIKEMISRSFNHHKPGQAPSIGLFASRRSGTTIVSEILACSKGLKQVDQPLSHYSAQLPLAQYLPVYPGSYIYDPTPAEIERIVAYLEAIRAGDLRINEQWRVWKPDFQRRTDRVVFKFTAGHALITLLPRVMQMAPIAFFRHPGPQSLSCLTRKWPPRDGAFFRQIAFLRQYFNETQIDYIARAEAHGSEFKRLLIAWTIENQPTLRAARDRAVPFFTHEWLTQSPREAVEFIAANVGVGVTPAMIAQAGRPSRTSAPVRTGSQVGKYLKSSDAQAFSRGWMDKLGVEQRADLEEVLETLPNWLYAPNRVAPAQAFGSAAAQVEAAFA